MPPETLEPDAVDPHAAQASIDSARPAASGPPRTPWMRIFGSFAIVLGLYSMYSVVAVPVIEPTISHRLEADTTEQDLRDARNAPELQRKHLAPWFQPNDWELISPKVIESPRGMLLFRDYETLTDGRLRVHPVTMISLPEGTDISDEERYRRAVILQAPEGAILQFDSAVDLKQAKVGKLIGGMLVGPITIRSDQREPGPQDDLHIVARDVELIGDRVISKSAVEFRMGPNQGTGQELEMQLAPAADPKPGANAPSFGGILSFVLKRNVRMLLQPGQADIFPGMAAGSKLSAAPPSTIGGKKLTAEAPVEIQCDGAFRFDANPYKATFHDQVDVKRANPSGPYDQLTCKVLTLHFDPVPPQVIAGAAPTGPGKAAFPKLEPARIEATGNPVIIRSPSRRVQARGQKLQYDIKRNSGSLTGPGWFKGSVPDGDATRPLEATWTQMLAFGPEADTQRLAIEGSAHVEVVGMGQLDAAGIYLYLVEQVDTSPQGGGKKRYVPVRLQATSSSAALSEAAKTAGKKSLPGVHIKSPQLSGDVHLLQAWFKQPTVAPPPSAAAFAAAPAVSQPGAVAAPGGFPPPHNPSVYAPAPQQVAAGPRGAPAGPQQAAPAQHFNVDGQLLQIEAQMGTRPQVSRVHIEGGVCLTETRVAEPGTRPLIVRGDRIDLEETTPGQGKVWVAGRPAHVEARELSLNGKEIELDRGANLALVNGPGDMTIQVLADLSGKSMEKPQSLELSWLGGMEFDGTEATFKDHVVGRLEDQRLTADVLRAFFDRPINFTQPAPEVRPQINRVLCQGNVFLERRTLVLETGEVATLERMKTETLSVEPLTGNLEASGPGWVRSVRLDNGQGFGLPGAGPGAGGIAHPVAGQDFPQGGQGFPQGGQGPPPPADGVGAAPARRGLGFLGIHFEGSLTGNQRNQTMKFQDRVRCAYGPAADWDTVLDPDEPDKLGASGAALTCDGLQVVQALAAPGRDPSFQLDAGGNVRVEGQTYSARSDVLTFDQEKDLLILKGNGRTDASLSRQERIGGPASQVLAGRIMFWPKSNRTQLGDVRQLNADNAGGLGGRR